MRLTLARAATLDHFIALSAVGLLGIGIVAVLSGAGADQLAPVALGGAAAAVGLGVLLTGGWIDPIAVVLIAAPLPAAYAAGGTRIAAVAPLTVIAVGGWFLQQSAAGSRIRLGAIPLHWLVVLSGALALSTLPSEYRGTAMRECINLGVMVLFLLLAVDQFVRRPATRFTAARLLFWSGAVCGVLAVLEAVHILPGQFVRWGTNFNRAALGFGQPNGLGLFFAIAIPFAVYEIKQSATASQRWLRYAALFVMVAGLMATFSRGSWVAILCGSLALLFAGERRFVLRIWLAALAAALVLELVSGGALSDTARRTPADWVLEQRVSLMLAGVLMFIDHPWLGVGPGGFEDELKRVGTEIPGLFDYLPTPHNAFIQMGAETGTIGLIAFVVLLAVLFRHFTRGVRTATPASAERELRRAVLWSFGSLLVCCMVMWPFAHGTGQIVMLICALGLADQTGRTLL